jgi:hypothetical protein
MLFPGSVQYFKKRTKLFLMLGDISFCRLFLPYIESEMRFKHHDIAELCRAESFESNFRNQRSWAFIHAGVSTWH